jgi:hypothetical protein
MAKKSKSDGIDLRQKLSADFVAALQADWAEHGPEVIQRIRQDNPVKYGELIARLVPMDANLSSANDFLQAKSMQDIARGLLREVGMRENEITDEMVRAVIESHDQFVARLEAIAGGH